VIKLVASLDGPSLGYINVGITLEKVDRPLVDRKLNAVDSSELSVKSVVVRQSQLHPSDEDGGSDVVVIVGKSPGLFPNRSNISSRSGWLKSTEQVGERIE